MQTFKIQTIKSFKEPTEIEKRSLEIIETECASYDLSKFSFEEKEVIKRLIHATTCFDQVINNIFFSKEVITKTIALLKAGAFIITDTNMIRSGLSNVYTNKYKNESICYVNDDAIKEEALKLGITRSYVAVRKAIIENKDNPMILACGNAPTFLYSAIETIINENINPSKIVFIAFPVGFVNVVDSKEYTKQFIEHYDGAGIIMRGRFGSSPMVVSCLHAAYKLIN